MPFRIPGPGGVVTRGERDQRVRAASERGGSRVRMMRLVGPRSVTPLAGRGRWKSPSMQWRSEEAEDRFREVGRCIQRGEPVQATGGRNNRLVVAEEDVAEVLDVLNQAHYRAGMTSSYGERTVPPYSITPRADALKRAKTFVVLPGSLAPMVPGR